MSEVSPSGSGPSVPPVPPVPESTKSEPQPNVYLVSYPKVIFLYPTVITSLLCSLFMWIKGGSTEPAVGMVPQGKAAVVADSQPRIRLASSSEMGRAQDGLPPEAPDEAPAARPQVHTYRHWCARIFLVVLGLNLVVMSFEFPRTTSLTWFFAISTGCIGLWFLFTIYDNLAPALLGGILSIQPEANASFYLIFTVIMLGLFVAVLVSRRVDYWEVRGNELLHHHGFLSNLERFSAPNLRIDKEITDVFEYLLLKSGRLIIHCNDERRAIVLENVLGIDKKERQITQMLGALQVRVRTDKE